MLTYDEAHRLFSYDPETGLLTRRITTGKKSKAGMVVGHPYSNGYLRVGVGPRGACREYLLHRLIWMMCTGSWPDGEIDHINGIRDDNRLSNLRVATSGENRQNSCRYATNKSGHRGVSWFRLAGKWRADITVSRKRLYLGTFDTVEAAAAAYTKAKSELHTFQPVARAS